MIHTTSQSQAAQVQAALHAASPSTRLRAAMFAGSHPGPELLDTLVDRCGKEPDHPVREMLTWAITRLHPDFTVPRVVRELASELPQARSQALHTLSKIGDRRAWPSLTRALLLDEDDEVARTAWRAAVALAPADEHVALATTLATQLGRGDNDLQRSLSRAMIALDEAATPALESAGKHVDPEVQAHAAATLRLREDPDADFAAALFEATRTVAILADPTRKE